MIYILLCGGVGSRFNNYSLPKPLNYINGKHMIEYIVENIPSNEIYIIYNKFLDEYNFKEIVINKHKNKVFHFSCIDYLTRGAVETAYIGIQHFDNLLNKNENIVFIDNDNLHNTTNIDCNFKDHFIGYSIDETDKSNYSFIQIENDYVVNIEEKKKISKYFCCGLYGFQNASCFIKYSSIMLNNNDKANNEFYFSQLYKLILNTDNVTPVYIDKTQHIGSYKEIINNNIDVTNNKLRICFDLDNTLLTFPSIANDYNSVKPIVKNVNLLNMFKDQGHEIIIYTARRMKTYHGNIGKVIKDIAVITIDTLEKFDIYYDELIFGKPIADIYIDDKSFNPYTNNISQYGFFSSNEDYLHNKVETNKYNSIQFIDNIIYKKGPYNFMRGELYYYQNIPVELSYNFPKLLDYQKIDINDTNIDTNTDITIQIEYIKGMPLFYLYKYKLITPKIINDLFNILNTLHSQELPISFNNQIDETNIRNNYFNKLIKRFENKKDYYFEDADKVYNEIIDGLNMNYSADAVQLIHGDFWFSNIIILYDDKYKLIDMKGQVDDILTLGGDRYYDYGKLYQSIIGYDLVLNGIDLDDKYIKTINNLFIQKCQDIGLNINYLKYVTKSLIFGSFHFVDKSEEIKQNIWNLLTSI